MITEMIAESAKRLLKLTSWFGGQSIGEGDLVVVNNSFVFRDVATTKADVYLALSGLDSGTSDFELKVVSGVRLNLDLKRFPAKEVATLRVASVAEAVDKQMQDLGFLLFLLIGNIEDSVVLEEGVGHQALQKAVWDPELKNECRCEPDRGITGQVRDEERVWAAIADTYRENGQPVPDGLREAVGIALDKLQERAEAVVHVPQRGAESDRGITDSIVKVLREQRQEYSAALSRYMGPGPSGRSGLNEVLRIAYNFSSDASEYLRLIVSICDLKPVVLWATIAEHFALSEAFRHLPWVRSKNKPSLPNYVTSIADARNTAFHNLFPFRKTLRVELPEHAIGRPSLRIFSEHGKKKENYLSYQDKELVDVLVGFTRARDRQVTDSFWQRNQEVMDKTIELFDATSAAIKELHRGTG